MPGLPITIIETPEYARRAKLLLSPGEQGEAINHIAWNFRKGVVVRGTGGLRKIRFAREGEGKSGGFRIAYFYYDDTRPVFLVTIYAKNEKDNLTEAERNAIRKISSRILALYEEGVMEHVGCAKHVAGNAGGARLRRRDGGS